MKYIKMLLIRGFVIIVVISMMNTYGFSEQICQETMLKYSSLFSNLKEACISKDKKEFRNIFVKLQKLKSELPVYLLLKEIANIESDLYYRSLLSDFLNHRMKYVGQKDFDFYFTHFVGIIKNNNQNVKIRRSVISAMTKCYLLNNRKEYNDKINSETDFIRLLKSIIYDKAEDTRVAAQAIHSLSRLHYNNMNEYLLNILQNWHVEDQHLVQSVSENLGRAKNNDAIPILIEIINFTDNEDIFVTAVYSIGLTESFEMIQPIVDNFYRFSELGRNICRATLRQNTQLLLRVVSENKTDFLIPSIIALGKIKEQSAIPYLKKLQDNLNYKEFVLETINQIKGGL
ncbi:hypothetical protein GMMP1_130038 [Candidatus Magnetomoraceae bacterium gMMP-1]